jgi:hypothetical protein
MMEAVHRYEGTVNQVMGDGVMALFGAPIAHEDHAVRACYAALRMQDSVNRYGEEARRAYGVTVQIRVGLNSGEVVVRAIGSDLHMDYTAVGETTHLAARMEQAARPGSVLIAPATLDLAEGFVAVKSLGPVPVKGRSEPVEVYELSGVGAARTRLQAAAKRGLMPATVQAILAARIDRLPAEDKRLLQVASVIGKDVPRALLEAVAAPEGLDLHHCLADLQAAELVYEAQIFPEQQYTFKHALTHEVAYGSLLHERRRAVHARIVGALEQIHAGNLGDQLERLAHHAVSGEAWEQALSYSAAAAAKAMGRSAYRDATTWQEQALQALAHLPETRTRLEQAVDLRLLLRNSLQPVGELRRVLDYLSEAEAALEKLGDQRRQSWLWSTAGSPKRTWRTAKRQTPKLSPDARSTWQSVMANGDTRAGR